MDNHFPLKKITKETIRSFKFILRKYQYTYDDFLHLDLNPFTWDKNDLPIFSYRFPTTNNFGILFHLFFLGRNLKLNIIKKVFDDQDIDKLLKIKILERTDNSTFQSTVFILPYKTYYFACDFILQLNDRPYQKIKKYEYVYPVSLDSVMLSESSIKRPVNSVLDLGCGSGVLGIIASYNSAHVTGIDINPRAVNFSKFNAFFNDAHNCRFLCGDLYNPVKEQKFDLILSNPPYEIFTQKSFLFQDGGKLGFRVLKRVIEGLSSYLNDGGVCQIITKVADFSNTKRAQLIRSWIPHNNLYVFFVELYKMNINQAAYTLSTEYVPYEEKKASYKKYSRKIEKILQFFESNRLVAVSFGIMTITFSSHFAYKEHILDSKNILAKDLSAKLQDLISMHFKYFFGYGNISIKRKIFLLLYYFYKKMKINKTKTFFKWITGLS